MNKIKGGGFESMRFLLFLGWIVVCFGFLNHGPCAADGGITLITRINTDFYRGSWKGVVYGVFLGDLLGRDAMHRVSTGAIALGIFV